MSFTSLIVLLLVVAAIYFFVKKRKDDASANGGITAPVGTSSLTRMNMNQALSTPDSIICDPSGGVFTGELWSDDNRTFCITVENGKGKSISSFHDNGQLAILHMLDGDDDGNNDTYMFFDEDANVIEDEEFNARYHSVWDRMKQQWPEH